MTSLHGWLDTRFAAAANDGARFSPREPGRHEQAAALHPGAVVGGTGRANVAHERHELRGPAPSECASKLRRPAAPRESGGDESDNGGAKGEDGTDFQHLRTPAGLAELARTADGIGPAIASVLEGDSPAQRRVTALVGQ